MNTNESADKPPDSDSPVDPAADSDIWFESRPNPIEGGMESAVLFVRLGMAQNALTVQSELARLVSETTWDTARWMRGVVSSLVTISALTFEASKLAKDNMGELRRLAKLAIPSLSDADLNRASQLCAGNHAAWPFIVRARNTLGFHWDKGEIEPSVKAFAENSRIVWLEGSASYMPVHRLALDVLTRALFAGESDVPDANERRRIIRKRLNQLLDAMNVLRKFLTAAGYGYLREVGARRREILLGPTERQRLEPIEDGETPGEQ